MTIRLLPPELVNQIAAGEVVERPASVVKELVENAIDAGAARISIRIEGGGRDLIEVVDDGAGIPLDELPLAVAAHATSKISSSDDLAAIATLGFRGEALASIGSVARLEVTSRPREQSEAGRIEVHGGALSGPMPASRAPGTTVRVSTLFFNVPARRKFLRSDAAETGRITDLVETIALAHPEVGFRLESGSRRVLDLPPAADRRARIDELLGPELAPELLEVNARGGAEGAGAGPIAVWGVVARPSAARASGRHQRLYVNGRPITDRSLLHAVKEAFRGVIDPSRHPVAVIRLDVGPGEVDVNVHPAKSEVRFRRPSAVYSFLLRAVRSTLRAADLVPMFPLGDDVAERDGSRQESAPGAGQGRAPDTWAFAAAVASPPRRPGFEYRELEAALAKPEAPVTPERREGASPAAPGRLPPPSPAPLPILLPAGAVLQVHRAYLVMEDSEGIVLIDQHALHERVMYEQLFERVMRGGLERQMLLVPLMIDAGPRATERVEILAPLLARLGFDASPAGPRSVAVHAVPSFLASRNVDAGEFLAELLDRDDLGVAATDDASGRGEPARAAAAGGASVARDGDEEAAIHAVIDMMACKAAVKAGERLTPEEIARLLEWRERIERSSNCPHGRPTSLRIPLREIEKRFGR